jgi:hypothetical protein
MADTHFISGLCANLGCIIASFSFAGSWQGHKEHLFLEMDLIYWQGRVK